LGVKSIVKETSTALASGDIVANQLVTVVYDGTSFQVIGLPIPVPIASMPIGFVGTFVTLTSIPSNYLIADGSSFVEATYPLLFTALDDSTTLPDYRGEFLRGADQGRGVDSGRVIGSTQSDIFKSHTHTTSIFQGSAGSFSGDGSSTNTNTNAQTAATGGTETRPRNVAVVYAIKAED